MKQLKLERQISIKVSAASGLVKSGKDFFVIADDELSLFQFNIDEPTIMKSTPLKSGTLPSDAKERKKQKPDWEALVKLDEDILLAIPSGSTDHRMTGVLVHLNSQQTTSVDFSKLYSKLKESFSELNIEGACILNNRLKLFQRGNGLSGINAIIDLDFNGLSNDLREKTSLNPNYITAIKNHDLGQHSGFKLDFTDACTYKDNIWYLAVAEASQSTYEDGQYHGAILGCLDSTGKELERYIIECAQKPEGLWVEAEGDRLNFYIVTDADDATISASIYHFSL